MEILDLAIVGAGPSGISAAIYAKRAGLNIKIFEKYFVGGQVASAFEIENYPGYSLVNGVDLAFSYQTQLKSLNIDVAYEEITKISKSDDVFTLSTSFGNEYQAKKVILALGTQPKKLGLDNEEKFIGKGVSFCATCDGNFYKDKNVVVVGGGNSAFTEALHLSNIVKHLTILVRSRILADKVEVDKVQALENAEIIENSVITKLHGEDKLTGIDIQNLKSGEIKSLECDGVFVYIGQNPPTNFVKELNILDEKGYIKVDEHFETSIKGLYSIGDSIPKEVRQIVTAVSDGASVIHHIK